MWELLEAVGEILSEILSWTMLDATLEEAPRWVRLGCTTLLLVVVLSMLGFAVWVWVK